MVAKNSSPQRQAHRLQSSRRSSPIATVVENPHPAVSETEQSGVFTRKALAGPVTRPEIAAWIIVAAALLFVLTRHMVAAVVAGFLFYLVLERLSFYLAKIISRDNVVRPLSLVAAALIVGAALTGAIALVISVGRAQANNIPALMEKMAQILDSTRLFFMKFGGYSILPEAVRDAEALKAMVVGWLKENSNLIGTAGGSFGYAMIHIIMAIFLATLVFFRHIVPKHERRPRGPLAQHLIQKIRAFAVAFSRIVVAQLKISAVNTTLTALYLLVALPLAGRPLPFAATIVFITFVCGLIPVLGNLISNTVIVIVSLGISPGTAIASLVFLVVIHKLEYLVNSKIVGGETDSQAWEILLAILVGEAAFGIPGIVLAPVIYAFVKGELKDRALI